MKKIILIFLIMFIAIVTLTPSQITSPLPLQTAKLTQTTKLTPSQTEVRHIAKEVGSKNCVQGFCFTEILQAIAWQESSYGRNLIGDSTGITYYFKHNDAHHNVNKKNTFITDGIRYTTYQPLENKYKKRVYTKTKWKSLSDSSIGAFQIKLSTAQDVIERMKLKEYYFLLSNEQLLVSKLFTDTTFGATIAVNFLKMHYIKAQAQDHFNPSIRAISRYNGGNENTVYINLILTKVAKL